MEDEYEVGTRKGMNMENVSEREEETAHVIAMNWERGGFFLHRKPKSQCGRNSVGGRVVCDK
jgi:hypothetical protein